MAEGCGPQRRMRTSSPWPAWARLRSVQHGRKRADLAAEPAQRHHCAGYGSLGYRIWRPRRGHRARISLDGHRAWMLELAHAGEVDRVFFITRLVWARRSAVSTAKVSEDPVSVSAQVVALAGNARKVIARQSSTVQHRLDEARAGIEPSTSPSCAAIAHRAMAAVIDSICIEMHCGQHLHRHRDRPRSKARLLTVVAQHFVRCMLRADAWACTGPRPGSTSPMPRRKRLDITHESCPIS